MNPIQIFIAFLNFTFEYDKEYTKELRFVENDICVDTLQLCNIEFSRQHGKIVIDSKILPFSFFEDTIEFITQCTIKSFDKPIIIQKYIEQHSVYFAEEEYILPETSRIIKSTSTDYFFKNAKTFLLSKEFFKNQANLPIGQHDFVDHFSQTSKTITFSSVIEKKKVKFNFPISGVLELNNTIDYSVLFQNFKNLYEENKQYSVFLKKSIIKNLITEEDPYKAFFRDLTKICEEAKIDFNVFIHELSIDSIKAEYKDFKQKYFSSQNEILTKLTTQIIALPISVTGILFGIDKLYNNTIALFIVVFGLVAYFIYVTYLMKIFRSDIYNLFDQSCHDYQQLKNQDFFVTLPNEITYFEKIKNEVLSRLQNLYFLIKMMTVMIWISTGFLIIYTLAKFVQFENEIQVILTTILMSAIFGLLYSSLFFKKNLIENEHII